MQIIEEMIWIPSIQIGDLNHSGKILQPFFQEFGGERRTVLKISDLFICQISMDDSHEFLTGKS